jgi:para-nitrobenzyl esterase
LKAVEKAYPNTTKPSDYIDIDLAAFRPGMVKHANLKADFGGAPVYAYLFTWQSPVNDGIPKAVHCIELGFVFNNIDRCQEMTGGGKEAKI